MSWIYVTRFVKTDRNAEKVQQLIEDNRKHWENVALDIGMDPAQNVMIKEEGSEVFIGISSELDMVLREEPGEWK